MMPHLDAPQSYDTTSTYDHSPDRESSLAGADEAANSISTQPAAARIDLLRPWPLQLNPFVSSCARLFDGVHASRLCAANSLYANLELT